MRAAFAGILAGLVALFSLSGSAEAAPSVKRPAVKSICETGSRGQKAYDAKCLKTGTVLDGVNLWFRYIDGGAVSKADRKAFCKDATSTGHTRAGIIDGLFDVAYDNYRNHTRMLSIAGTVGVWDCQALGVKIKK
ncbi:hypothetical protein SEA_FRANKENWEENIE_361 [Streptomyces phage Frankenweenie]|nr:hypothetical protein SEA_FRANKENWEENIE_361 [Streptomyces phage Frankenweenie]